VAQQAGVSPATVSRVLNNTAVVRDSVRQRVLQVVSDLGYQSPPYTTAPAGPSSIALLIPDILNPYFTEIVRGVQTEGNADGFMPLVLDTHEDADLEQNFLRTLANQPIAGIIAVGSRTSNTDLASIRSHQNTPLVILNRIIHLPNVACIVVDLENATYRAARHLLDLGHTRIAFLPGPASSETSHLRRRGVEKALAEFGLDLSHNISPATFPDIDGGFQAMSAVLAAPSSEHPTAVLCYNDLMAMGALHAIRTQHLRCPEDISVIGIDNIAMAAHTNPPLTTLSVPKAHLGRIAMTLLRRMIAGQPPPEDGYTLVECTLLLRESTGPCPHRNGN
jgi:DNA-binding LacI/PurR family transcriptional regulator